MDRDYKGEIIKRVVVLKSDILNTCHGKTVRKKISPEEIELPMNTRRKLLKKKIKRKYEGIRKM